MNWSELYDNGNQPTDENITDFIGGSLWRELNSYLQRAYPVKPKMTYSNCAMDNGIWRGWNVKYQKSGKALCTLYPRQGFFDALVVIGAKEMPESELLMPFCCEYTQKLFNETQAHMGGKWLMMKVADSEILEDVKKLVALRVPPK